MTARVWTDQWISELTDERLREFAKVGQGKELTGYEASRYARIVEELEYRTAVRQYETKARRAVKARDRHQEPYVVMVTDWNGDTYPWGYSEDSKGSGAMVTARLVPWVVRAWVEKEKSA